MRNDWSHNTNLNFQGSRNKKIYVKATENSELSEISYDNGIFMYCHCKGKFSQNGNPGVQKVRQCVNEYYIYILLYKSIIKW